MATAPGTLIVYYVHDEFVRTYLVPSALLTPKDREVLAKAHGLQLPNPDCLYTKEEKKQEAYQEGLEACKYLRARIDALWAQYSVASDLGFTATVTVRGQTFNLASYDTESATETDAHREKTANLRVTEMFCFTEDI